MPIIGQSLAPQLAQQEDNTQYNYPGTITIIYGTIHPDKTLLNSKGKMSSETCPEHGYNHEIRHRYEVNLGASLHMVQIVQMANSGQDVWFPVIR